MEQINRDAVMRDVVVVGRGAIGAVYCQCFAQAASKGVRLRVAVDEKRKERYQREEFLLNGKPLKLDYFTPQKNEQPVDLVIITTKWEGYHQALQLVEGLVGEKTVVLPLLNGLLPYEMASERFGENCAMRGYYIGHTATRNGAVASQDGAYKTVVGERVNNKNCYSSRLLKLIELFETSGVKYRVDEDMEGSRWLKYVINLGLNQASAIDGGLNYGELRESKYASELCVKLMEEVAQVAKRLSIGGADEMVQKAIELLSTLPDEDYSSMAQDVLAGRVTEWPIFGGHLLTMAEKLGIQLPFHQKMEQLLK